MRFAHLLVLSSLAVLSAQAPIPPLGYRVAPEWPQLPPGWNFQETAATAVDTRNSHVYVIHRGQHPVMEFDQDGRFLRSFGDGLFERPHAIRIDAEGFIWTVDDGAHTVLKLDASGRVRMVLGRWKAPSSAVAPVETPPSWAIRTITDQDLLKFNRPTDVAFDPAGNIYVADGYGNSRVVKFSREGKFLREWGRRGREPGEFNTPHAIAVDQRGRVYVADRENYRVQVFDGDGKFLHQWRNLGSPWGLQITPQQELYMADGYNGRVLKLTLDGAIVGTFGSMGKLPGQLLFVHHLSVAPDHSVYTAEILNWRPQKFVLPKAE
ncbi:MAG: peptidyl-alpha-hydroxyglycine alpha-amidating lyase family protein [Acidobacteria bacterium]|nr:peptidyl-alpha-hydroxyglycine alpha-amidating lyase family protein [Acidobacteriota bacterium]